MAFKVSLACVSELPWYVAFTDAHQERVARHHLESQGYQVWLPMLTVHEEPVGVGGWGETALFPRYLFIRPGVSGQELAAVRHTPGIDDLVCFNDKPLCISQKRLTALRQIVAEQRQSEATNVSALNARPVSGAKGHGLALSGTLVWRSPMLRVSHLIALLGQENAFSLPQRLCRAS